MNKYFSGLLLLLICSLQLPSLAAQPLVQISPDKLEKLANSQQWQHLLHYRLHPYTLRFMSQNDSENFFLSPQGKRSLQAELTANLAAFLQTDLPDNASMQCRFPARYQWLKSQLPQVDFIDQACSEFDAWQAELDASYLTLIFPAAHINSPSSMYGHTLIRLDKADENSSKLLAYSANFAANANRADNELKFTWKGLTGGYPGVISVLPYYAKTNEYSRMEARDIWEYKLGLTQEEVAQFVRHLWEIKDGYFDYFFFDENCSYRLLALLDASSSRLDLAKQFRFTALPVDTLRALQQAGLVEDKHYRPSAASEMEHKSQESSEEVLRLARLLVDNLEVDINSQLTELSGEDASRTLELAYAYARYLSVKKRQANPQLRRRTLELLSARAKQPVDAGYTAITPPAYSDDQGHKSQRLQLGWGFTRSTSTSARNQAFTSLAWRMAYHDVMDLPQGFTPGAQILMGDFTLRAWEKGKLELEKFTVLDILSISEQTALQSPIAWSVSTGGERLLFADADLHYYLKAGFGKAYLNSYGRFYALAEAQLLAAKQLHKGFQLSAGSKLGWLATGQKLQARLEINYQGLTLIDRTQRLTALAEMGVRLTDNLQLKLTAQQQRLDFLSSKGSLATQFNSKSQQNFYLQTAINWYF